MTHEKQTAVNAVEEKKELICQAADHIWSNPELSLMEDESAAYYCDILEKEGFRVERGICGIRTAFSASFGNGSPKIGILAEYDALSGLSQEADRIYQEAIQDGSAGPAVFNRMGMGFMETEQYEQALECFEQAIAAGNGAGNGSSNGENSGDEKGGSDGESSGNENSSSENSGSGDETQALKQAAFNRAVALEYLGRYEEALTAFREYTAAYGTDEAAQKEITFLETR